MSADGVHEIVIIKRVSGGHEDEHHGGVWKIAFADFMTAMMAFFLVMWLISANDKTKATIARYFNPVQLVDSTPQPRGLEDPKPGAPSVMPRSGSATTDPKAKDSKDSKEAKDAKPAAAQPPKAASEADAAGKTAKDDENNLFRDPYAVLAELAAKDKVPPPGPVSKSPTEGKVGGSGAIGVKGGDAYRDPFDPAAAAEVSRDATAGDPAATENPAAAETAADQAEAAAPSPAPTSAKSAASAAAKDPPKPNAADAAPATSLNALRAEVQAIVKSDGALAGHGPAIEVHQTQEGLLVDVTDGTDFAMFGNASARPSPKTVVIMEKIGRLLKAQPGQIVLRGFTDNRPFKSDTYDNWRLSAARADMAHYMLVRGGIDERRFDRIEGYADRRPKDANDPASPVNRRIQILIRGPNP